MMSEKNPWIKFGWQVYHGQKNILNLLVYLQSLKVDFVDTAKWAANHGAMLTEEEQKLITEFDEIVNKTAHYYGLFELSAEPEKAQQKVIENIEQSIAQQTEALNQLKSDLENGKSSGKSTND